MDIEPLRLLEVAALPFPTRQGTQALLKEQCEALAARGHDVHLCVYAHAGYEYEAPYRVHRLADWPRERSNRSGPSWRKLALDGLLVVEIRRLCRALRPDVVHAHNYEALVACLAARPRVPLVYHAHTLFGYELETYFSGPLRWAAKLGGVFTDRAFPPLADRTLAVSQRLCDELVRRGLPRDRIAVSLPGITLPDLSIDREKARHELGLEGFEVIGYCGNLDGYQGLPALFEVTARVAIGRRRVRLLFVTTSDPAPLWELGRAHAIADRLVVVEHRRFAEALQSIAAADVCVVSRTAPGGFPIKLLTYLAASRPVVCTRTGAAGIDFGDALSVVEDGDGRAMAEAILWLFQHEEHRERRGRAGRRLVEDDFSWERRVLNLERQLADAAGRNPLPARSEEGTISR